MRNSALYLILYLVSFCVACEKQDADDSLNLTLDSCQYEDVLLKAVDEKGIIAFDSTMETYNIYTGIDGSYDKQIVGVVCNLPKEFQKNETSVVFSGNYYELEDAPDGRAVGQSFYNLELEKIELFE